MIYKHINVLWKTTEGLIQVICKHRQEIYQTRGVLHRIYKHREKGFKIRDALLRHAWRVKFCVTVAVFVCSFDCLSNVMDGNKYLQLWLSSGLYTIF